MLAHMHAWACARIQHARTPPATALACAGLHFGVRVGNGDESVAVSAHRVSEELLLCRMPARREAEIVRVSVRCRNAPQHWCRAA